MKMRETEEQQRGRWQRENAELYEQREFTRATDFITEVLSKTFATKNPQMVECVEGRILTRPTLFEAVIEMRRCGERVLTPLENKIFTACFVDGILPETKIRHERLRDIRTKLLAEWWRVGVLPLYQFLEIPQATLDADAEAERQAKQAEDAKAEEERKERGKNIRELKSKAKRARPRDRAAILAQIEELEREERAA